MEIITSRKQLKTFDTAVVSNGQELLSEIIQSCERIDNQAAGMFNHGFKIYIDSDVNVIEAEAPGIKKDPFNEYLTDGKTTMLLVLRPNFAFKQSDIDYMLSFVDKAKYDFAGLLGEAVRFLTTPIARLFGKKNGLWLGSNMTSNKRFMCGMYCAAVDNNSNPGMFNIPIPEIAPSDLVQNLNYTHYWVNLDALRKEIGF